MNLWELVETDKEKILEVLPEFQRRLLEKTAGRMINPELSKEVASYGIYKEELKELSREQRRELYFLSQKLEQGKRNFLMQFAGRIWPFNAIRQTSRPYTSEEIAEVIFNQDLASDIEEARKFVPCITEILSAYYPEKNIFYKFNKEFIRDEVKYRLQRFIMHDY